MTPLGLCFDEALFVKGGVGLGCENGRRAFRACFTGSFRGKQGGGTLLGAFSGLRILQSFTRLDLMNARMTM